MFNRSLVLIEKGIKPVWVFDGLPPNLKKNELTRRRKVKQDAREKFSEAKEVGDMTNALKQHQRQVKMTNQTVDDAMTMLTLMGLPVIKASSEAEAQCVDLLKKGLVQAVASEDMDCLTFGCKLLLKGFKSRNEGIVEIDLERVLKNLELTMEQFVDFCILCGCDYCKSIKNLGPVRALKYIKEYKTIEKVLVALDLENKNPKSKLKFVIPTGDDFLYEQARELFNKPDVLSHINKVMIRKYKLI